MRVTSRRSVVVVGNGMVSHRFCEALTDRDTERAHRVVVFGEEPRPAYDRVHLTQYFAERCAEKLLLGTEDWYQSRGVELRVGCAVAAIHRDSQEVETASGERVPYDVLVLATGSAPFVPPVAGRTKRGVFVYRTLEDLEAIARYREGRRRVAVVGGGLLGLEAARAMVDSGAETHVVELAPRLMPRQLDARGSALLARSIEGLGVRLHLGEKLVGIAGEEHVTGLCLESGVLPVDLVILSAGIKPRDELARAAGILVGPRGGVVVDDQLRTSDPGVYAIGEVALHQGTLYGLVGPGYEMADTLARHLLGEAATFGGGDLSSRLKLLGTDVASFGDPFADEGTAAVVVDDEVRGIYKKLVVRREDRRLVGGILVGDAKAYGSLLHLTRSGAALSADLGELGLAGDGEGAPLPDDAPVCSCNNVLGATLRQCVRDGTASTVAELKACTRAGTGCGGCVPAMTSLLTAELAAQGKVVKRDLCEHFAYSRQELFQIIAATGLRTFGELLARYGRGHGCEICKPTIASLLASIHNEPVLSPRHATLQDSNDRFLANIQKNGTYSVVPRIAAGEVTPEQLIVLGEVAKEFGLYTKITGGQRIDLFGARVEDLPVIWERLVAAGFESGHAYGKAMRTVKSCVGSTWCRYGVQDSTAFAIRIEHRYKGIRAPHKLKSAVSGCVRECAEAQSKDFGLIATEKGWNIYVGGNGGVTPRHAELLVADVDEDTAVRYLDRFIMLYIRTADRLTRTSAWVEGLEGGIDYLRKVIVEDSLGIGADLEAAMEALVGSYSCEWADVLRDPEKRARFRHFAGSDAGDPTVRMVPERGQLRPAPAATPPPPPVRRLPIVRRRWVPVAAVADVPPDGGIAVPYGSSQIAVFHFASRGEWYATQNACPHKREMVLARGIVGDQGGVPKVACPLHKRLFSLEDGACLSGDSLRVATFPVRIEGDRVLVELPPEDEIAAVVDSACGAPCAEALAS